MIYFVFPSLSTSHFGADTSVFLRHIDMKLQTDAVYLDLRKAFDSIPHDKLLVKLFSCGISGMLGEWFREYLSSRISVI